MRYSMFHIRLSFQDLSCSLKDSKGKLVLVDHEGVSVVHCLLYLYLHSTLRTGGRLVFHKQPRRNMGSNASGESESTSPPH